MPAYRDLPQLKATFADAEQELEAAFAGAEQELSAKSWRRFVEDDRVHLKIADPDGELFFVERLFVD